MVIKAEIEKIIFNAVSRIANEFNVNLEDLPKVKVEYPREEKFGDYATSIALECARILRKSPLEIGERIKDIIIENDLFEKVEVVKPGFINMFLSINFLQGILNNVIEQKDNFGKTKNENPKKINIEFVSANPTGPLNVVSARAAAIGDTLANLLEATGNHVEREFYVNDYGNQVWLLGKSVWVRYRQLKGDNIDFPEDGYHGEYVKDIAKYIDENFKNELESLDSETDIINFMAKKAIEFNVENQKKDLEKFNVIFQNWFFESTLHKQGLVKQTLEYLESVGEIIEENSKKIFISTKYGDDKDRVVVREDGRPTYFMADIAYHKTKIDRGYDLIMDIWGPDHHGYIARLKGAMQALGCEENRFKVLIAQQVNLIMDGETVKMSKRLGTFSTMKDLIDEIGTDVARYFFVMRSIESHLDFDIELAKRQSTENPVFYLQYAHARICSIFREAAKRNLGYEKKLYNIGYLNNNEAKNLIKMIARFPEEIIDASESYEPHRITVYAMRLAQAFHKFYTVHRILSDDYEKTQTYLLLCDAVKIVLKNALKLLGVSAPEKM